MRLWMWLYCNASRSPRWNICWKPPEPWYVCKGPGGLMRALCPLLWSHVLFSVMINSGFRHLKDVILLTAIVQVLSTISSYFWYLWLLVRAFVVPTSFHFVFHTRHNLSLSCVCVPGPGPCTLLAVGKLPGPLVYGRKPVGAGGGEREEAEKTRAQADETILMLQSRRSSIFIRRI